MSPAEETVLRRVQQLADHCRRVDTLLIAMRARSDQLDALLREVAEHGDRLPDGLGDRVRGALPPRDALDEP